MTVQRIFYNNKLLDINKIDLKQEDETLERLVHTSMLCNDTKISTDNQLTGDPTETALDDMGYK